MKRLVTYWVYTCHRCNARDHAAAKLLTDNRVAALSDLPPGWAVIDGKHFCAGCVKVITEAMTCPY